LEPLDNTGCLALARLNDEGIPAGCEGDIPALFTMIVNRLITGNAAFMANPSRIDVESNCITMAHCTVPMSMVKSFGFKTHFESGKGVGIAGKLKKGPVTVSKIHGHMLDHFYVGEGFVTKNTESEGLCRTQIVIKLDRGVNTFFNGPLGNHHIINNGRQANRFKEVMALFDAVESGQLRRTS
jgi:L-fucose isomerase-like protein